jgi:hypothetical protein
MFEVAFGARAMPLAFPGSVLATRSQRSEPAERPAPEPQEQTFRGCFGGLSTIDEMVVRGLAASGTSVYDEP